MNFIVNESAQKLRGGYYTPAKLADYIARWTLGHGAKEVLEPSCGDGVFVDSVAAASDSGVHFHGFELFPEEARKAKKRAAVHASIKATITPDDFLPWAIGELLRGAAPFDAVVGNPPFVRYQYLDPGAQRNAEAIFKILGLPFTKHTNAWVPFVLASIALLKPGGRLGMILPAEIIHVRHARPLRSYLGSLCSRLLIIDPEEIWFDGTLQGAVILFAEKKKSASSHAYGIGITPVVGDDFLSKDAEKIFSSITRINGQTAAGKWTRALLTQAERDLLDRIAGHTDVHEFREVATVDVGIVTGANEFFLVDDATVASYSLEEFAHPMFGRSGHCPGVIYDAAQHEANAAQGFPTNFLWFNAASSNLISKKTRRYIEAGERPALHSRYKCRIRKPWYRVPSVYATEVGMLKRAHDIPRLILNKINAYTTDTAYRITPLEVTSRKLVSCFINPLTALSGELEGRHYGGGVLELVPSEIEELLVPLPKGLIGSIEKLDEAMRRERATVVLASHGFKVMRALGVCVRDCEDLMVAWTRLKNRRQRITESEANLSQSNIAEAESPFCREIASAQAGLPLQ
jgi:adenine-specific DNA methylase